MTTTRFSVPAFLGGISQQSPAIRRSSLVEDAVNVEFFPSEGATKRQPSRFVRELEDDHTGNRVVTFERDGIPYTVVFGNNQLYVFDENGQEIIVYGDAPTYLTGAAFDDIRYEAIADSIWVVNRNKVVVEAPGKVNHPDIVGGQIGINVIQANYGVTYTVEFQTSGMGQPVEATVVLPNGPVELDNLGTQSFIATPAWLGGEPIVLPLEITAADNLVLLQSTTSPGGIGFSAVSLDPFENTITCLDPILFGSGTDTVSYQLKARTNTKFLDTAWVLREIKREIELTSAPVLFETGDRDSSMRLYTSTPFDTIDLLEVRDSRDGDFITGWSEEVSSLSKLPLVYKHGAVVKVVGDNNLDPFDDYYVEFASADWGRTKDDDGVTFEDSFAFGQGSWNETGIRGASNGGFDATTMPHVLQRKLDDDKGSTTGMPYQLHFEWRTVDWDLRDAGNDDTNKPPSFVGQTINDIFFSQNRLGFLAQSEIILSETGVLTNFWRSTVIAVPGSERIDFSPSGLQGETLYHAVTFDGELFVFSEEAQARVFGEPSLTPQTVSAPVVSRFKNSSTMTPIISGKSLFFGYTSGQYTHLREFFPGQERETFDEALVTLAVPKLIPSTANRLLRSPVGETMVAFETGTGTLYLYQFQRVSGQLLQASWTTWDFAGDIVDVGFVDSDLVMLINRENITFLEKIELGQGRFETGSSFVARLDSQVAATNPVYDNATDRTTFTCPWTFTASTQLVMVAASGGDLPYGVPIPIESRDEGLFEVTLKGDYRFQPMLIGRPYDARIELSKPLVKTQTNEGEAAVLGGSQTVREFHAYLNDTGYLDFSVQCIGQDTSSDEFLVDHIDVDRFDDDVLRSGEMRVGIHSDIDDFKVVLSSSSPLPFTLVSGAWDIRFNPRQGIS